MLIIIIIIMRIINNNDDDDDQPDAEVIMPLMWKLMTGEIADQIYRNLDQKKLLPEEQKG